MPFTTVNPADGSRLREYSQLSTTEVADALEHVSAAQQEWRRRPLAERLEILAACAERLRNEADEHATLMAREMGKPLAQGRSEVEKCAWACDHYVETAPELLAPESIDTESKRSFVSYQPLGVLLAIMPWNFPYWQVFRVAAPNLAAGNAILLKHAANTTGCGLAIEKVLQEAGLPEHVFRTLIIDHDQTGELIGNPAVHAVTLTGSTRAGHQVGELAGHALKKHVLELGGSDPYVVLEDADVEKAAETCVTSRLINGGQSCIAAKRFIVVEPVLARFTELLVEGMEAKKMDDPFADGVDLGPQARVDLRDELHRQVEQSIARGARLRCGGKVPDRAGAWYPPTVLDEVKPGMPAHDDEMFGPVAAVIGARDEAEAIRIANDTPFGLGAAVFTADIERGQRIAEQELQAGACFVNSFVKSDPRLPFGGVKQSGHGRELGVYGLREFVNVKTVVVE